jgi:spore maturation protein CgeB
MRESHLAISPFGWGEITDRDFRIINAGTVLVKPDMSHLQTEPNVFRPGETYAPVKWDFSDLEEVCEYYLSRPAEARELTENAVEAYDDFFHSGRFVEKVGEILARLERSG